MRYLCLTQIKSESVALLPQTSNPTAAAGEIGLNPVLNRG